MLFEPFIQIMLDVMVWNRNLDYKGEEREYCNLLVERMKKKLSMQDKNNYLVLFCIIRLLEIGLCGWLHRKRCLAATLKTCVASERAKEEFGGMDSDVTWHSGKLSTIQRDSENLANMMSVKLLVTLCSREKWVYWNYTKL